MNANHSTYSTHSLQDLKKKYSATWKKNIFLIKIKQVSSDVIRTGRVSTPETPLLYKSNKNTNKFVKINFFRTLKVNQQLVTIQEAFIQENAWLSVRKVSYMVF